jgi:hypothetical protein
MKAIKYFIFAIVALVLVVIITSYVIWFSYPKKKINIVILDKTVKDFNYVKHRSLFWVLNNARIVKKDGRNYNYKKDYYGFCPIWPLSNKQYKIRHYFLEQIDSLSDASDALYFTDTHGVYFNEWFMGFKTGGENSMIEGGLNQNDFLLLKAMMKKKKLVIMQYNTLEKPTPELIRYKTEELMGVYSTGWTGKYFSDLDSSDNSELPQWIVNKYLELNNKQWPFHGPGIVLKGDNNIIVLQKDSDLQTDKPFIDFKDEQLVNYGVQDNMNYLNWFEVVNVADTNEVLANYILNLTARGDSMLAANNLKAAFPAVISCHRNGLNMYYFTGSFSENPVNGFFARMANSRKLLTKITSDDRKLFFQNFYFPLTESIFLNYINSKK